LYETEKLEGEKQSKGKQHGWRTRPSSEILLPPCLKRSPLACAAHLEVDIVHQIFSMLAWIVNIFLSTFTWMLTFSMLFFNFPSTDFDFPFFISDSKHGPGKGIIQGQPITPETVSIVMTVSR
jgi:hypothetical protein